ncbi:fused MFS/spermidine synthase [bacterium]|nr:fused MFS/spermidine synthase [bacterium]
MKKFKHYHYIRTSHQTLSSRVNGLNFLKPSIFLGIIITVLFFISGLTGLIYEVTWTRMFTSIFGNTTYAVSAVLAAYMGGLALGSYVIGRSIDKRQKLLKIYSLLELGIGGMALLMPCLLKGLNDVYALLFQNFNPPAALLLIIKIIFSFAVLLIPTFLMGGTLPLLSKYFVRQKEEIGKKVGLLYAVNTLGAMCGCFLTGFLLLEIFGINKTIQIAALVNIFLGVIFFLLSMHFDSKGDSIGYRKEPELIKTEQVNYKIIGLLIVGFGLSGFISLSFEVLWSRLLVFKLHTTVYAFSIMLTTFLAGLGLGSLLFTLLERTGIIKNHFKVFGFIEAAIGILGLSSIFLFGRFESISNLWEALTWRDQIFKQMFLSGLIMIGPTILMGMTLPLVTRIYTRSINHVGASLGKLYSVNTLGGIFGSLITGFFLVEWLGTQTCIVVISVVAVLLGSIIIAVIPWRRHEKKGLFKKELILPAMLWILVIIMLLILPANILFQYYNIGEKQVDSQVKILYANEGVECITTVHRYPDGNRVISTGSMNVAGTDFTLRTTQKLQAHIPMLLHPNPKDVLQVGFGSGETSHILTTYETEHVDIVEISKGVLETSAHYFADINQDVIHNPKFRAIIMDGANYVALTDQKYDLILNDSIWPFYSGNSGLYTREYFENGRKHLKKGGIMTSWLPVEMPEESFKSLLYTFHSVFPHVSIWMAVTHYNKHALIVGSEYPLHIDMAVFLKRFRQFAQDDLKLVNLNDPVYFLDAFKMDERGLNDIVKKADLHTLDRPVLEFAPRFKNPGKDRARSYELIMRNTTSLLPYIKNNQSSAKQATKMLKELKIVNEATKHLMAGLVMRDRGEGNFLNEFQKAKQLVPSHPGVKYLMNELMNFRNVDVSNIEKSDFNTLIRQGKVLLENRIYDKAAVVFEKAEMLNPKSSIVHYNLGVVYYHQGLFSKALSQLNDALHVRSDHASSYNMRGLVFFAKNQRKRAISDFSMALSLDNDYWLALNNRGIAHASEGEFEMALKDFSRAIKLKEDYAEAYFNRGLLYQTRANRSDNLKEAEFKKVISDYTKAITLDPDYDKAYSNRGMIYAMEGQFALAISDFDKVIELTPDQADAYYNRGLAYYLSKDTLKARRDFNRAIQLDSEYKKKMPY